jgi:tetratricopeptide (TPR) repeat protein
MEISRQGNRNRLAALISILIVLASVSIYQRFMAARAEYWLENATVEQLNAALEDRPDDVAILEHLALKARQSGNIEKANAAFEKLAQIQPGQEQRWIDWAISVGELRGALAAEAILKACLKEHPRSARARVELSRLYYAAEDKRRSLQYAREATEADPRLMDAWRMRGQAALLIQEFIEAEDAFRQAARLDTQDWRPLVGLSRVFLQQRRFTDAITPARDAVRLAPQEAEAHLHLGMALVESARSPVEYEAGRQSLMEAWNRRESMTEPNRFDTIRFLGESYARESNWKAAKEYLEQAAILAPGSVEVHYTLVRVYRGLGDNKLAKAALERQKVLDRYHTEARQLIARIGENPGDAGIQLRLARLYASFGNFVDAAKIYQGMIASDLEKATAQRELRELKDKYAPRP